jgi:hypothetical protein
MAREVPEFSYRTRRQRPAVDPAMRRIALGAGGIAIAVIAVAMLWSGVRPRGFGPPPEIKPPSTPLRVAPADPGGLTVPGANVAIMSDAGAAPAPSLAAPPPAPALAQLQQQSGVQVLTPPAPAPAPAPPPAAAPASTAAPAPAADVEVQLAAAVSQAAAEQSWSAILGKMPGLVGGKKPEFVPAVVDGQNIWRLRLGGFADQAAASAFCAQVVAQGGDCALAAP